MTQAWVYLEVPLPPPVKDGDKEDKDRGVEVLDIFDPKDEET